MRPKHSIVSVVDDTDFCRLEDQLRKQRGARSEHGYEIWKRFDENIREVIRQSGKLVGWDDGVDFYHSGDWFHELHTGFALKTTTALSGQLLLQVQEVVAKHHVDADLCFVGDIETPMFGLNILVTPIAIHAAWYKSTADVCRRNIKKAGVEIL